MDTIDPADNKYSKKVENNKDDKRFEKDGFTFIATPQKRHKYEVFKNCKKIANFGGIRKNGVPYGQFKDKIGYYSEYDNNNKKRQKAYYKRHNKPVNKYSPSWFSSEYLW
jgi:hypothetical protein